MGSSSDRASDGVPRALVIRHSSVGSVARGKDEIDSLFDASPLTSGVSATSATVGSRMARRQMSKRRNIEAVANLQPMLLFLPERIDHCIARTFDFST